ncbi:MAG: ATP-binding protein [Silvibacterium sp.]
MATFKARARALDMLGRQQIAGVPTAINELFKNAHDAYADKVEVDFYRSDELFLLRDDGVGMTRDDFESRWLTLGTESKVKSSVTGMSMPKTDPTKPLRPILGEKGIGRLAIAVIGPQVLVLTRAADLGLDSNGELTAAFVQWSLFQCPGINLDQIDVPIRTFAGGTLPSAEDVASMVEDVRLNLQGLRGQIDQGIFKRIISELSLFRVDPCELDALLGAPSLSGNGTGTSFYVMPADPSVTAVIDERSDGDSATALKKMLLGFTNTMTPGHPKPQITAMFRDHRTDDSTEDLIDEQTFFTPEEFKNADHHLIGKFDDYGQFKGSISVYGEDYPDHVVAWDGARGKPTDCGPFSISVAYVQGASSESTLPPNDWAIISSKLKQIGGLYIYKDNIRILPYGTNDYDFLDIERNRTKSAGYYYFSYRRIFGVIEISQATNPELNEKAGREGFRENRAYRQFRAILMNFFQQVAADFFREGSAGAERYWERKAEIDRVEKARRKQEKQLSVKRKTFGEQLKSFFVSVESGDPDRLVAELLESLRIAVDAAIAIKDVDEASRSVIQAESDATQSLLSIRRRFRVVRPNGVGLSKQLRRDWDASTAETLRLESTVFAPTEAEVNRVVGELAASSKLNISMRVRIERAITERITDTLSRANVERKETREALDELNRGVTETTREIVQEVESAIQQTRSNLARLDLSQLEDQEIVEQRHSLESELTEVADRGLQSLSAMKDDLRAMHWSRDEDGRFVGMSLMNEALQEDLLATRERSEADLELTQVGMALSVVNHEFESSIRAVRGSLRRLKSWADVNTDLAGLYTDLRTSFDHIDGYLSLFTPLQRRLYRSEIDFSGADIAKFLTDLFSRRLERHNVELRPSRDFLKYVVHGYPSSFYPVFVNLVDNAIFWIKDRPLPRIIWLEAKGNAMVVRDSGVGISDRDREAIFDLGFTRKPGGRGLGLHIAREVLSKVGYELLLAANSPKGGAEFIIQPEPTVKESE